MSNAADATDTMGTPANAGAQPPAKAGLFSRKRLMLGGGVLAVFGALFAAFVMFTETGASLVGGAGESATPVPPRAFFLDLPDMTINLASPADQTMYLKLKVALEVSDQRTISRIEPLLPRIVDAFQVHLREMRPQDLQGSEGVYRIKEELLGRVNAAVYPSEVRAVLLREMIVQ